MEGPDQSDPVWDTLKVDGWPGIGSSDCLNSL